MAQAPSPVSQPAHQWESIVEVWSRPGMTRKKVHTYVKRFHTANADAFLESFIHEAASKVSTGVATFYEQILADGRLAIRMEFCGNGDLLSWLEYAATNQKPFHPQYLPKLAYKMIETIVTLHDNRIAHRKIELKHWVYDSNDIIRLIDFGGAKLVQTSTTVNPHTMVNREAYVSPEVKMAEKNQPFDNHVFKQDVWSLGKVIFEMAILKTPEYLNTMPGELLHEKLLSSLSESNQTTLFRTLEGMLNPEVAQRFTAQEALAVLREDMKTNVEFDFREIFAQDRTVEEEKESEVEEADKPPTTDLCSQCHMRFATSKVLPCSHRFCFSCFEKNSENCMLCYTDPIFSSQSTTEDLNRNRCPGCKKKLMEGEKRCFRCFNEVPDRR